jgi:hypothetical protein
MIKVEARFDEYAYRVADALLDSSVTTVEEGQWVTFNAAGNLVVAGADAPKSFLVIGSKRAGRNQVAGVPVKKVSYLHGVFRLKVSNFDPAGTYAATMTPLKVIAGGILAPWVSGTDNASLIVAWAQGQPVDGYLSIFSA